MKSELQQLLDRLCQRSGVSHPEKIIACIDDSRELAAHNEEGVAFENLCQNLFEWDFPLTKEDFAEIERLGRHYRFEESTWDFLATLLPHSRSRP